MGKEIKITPDAPKNENELTQMIMMGKSIHSIWINSNCLLSIFHSISDGNRCKLCQVRYIKCKNCKCKNCKAKVCEAGKVCRAKKRRHLSTKRHKEMVKWLAIDITVEDQMDDRGEWYRTHCEILPMQHTETFSAVKIENFLGKV